MIISASQLKTFQRCPRLWWFEKIRKMPRKGSTSSQVLGKVLHSVCERYLKADASGRHPRTGEPVELYPEGWHVDEEGNAIPPEQQEIVKALVEQAIEEGVLRRVNGATVEEHFVAPIAEGVYVQGFIDLCTPNEIVDHKTTSRMRYAQSEASLKEDLQMLLYAEVKDKTRVRHNVYCTDPDDLRVRTTEAAFTKTHRKKKWKEMQAMAEAMKALRDRDLEDEEFLDVEAPLPAKGEDEESEKRAIREACNAYGGCQFVYVCSKQETPKNYRKRKLNVINPDTPKAEEKTHVTLLHGVVKVKGYEPGRTMTLAELTRYILDREGCDLKDYYSKNALQRRDAMSSVLADVLDEIGSITVLVPPHVGPDQQALLDALALVATSEYVSRVS